MVNRTSGTYLSLNLSIFQHLEREYKRFENSVAISYYGKQITYHEMFFEIDRVARALKACGVKKDDVVAASLPGIPEGIYLIYAINKIGAIYCAFDCRAKASEIMETVAVFKPKICFVPDFQLPEAKDITSCPVVCVDPTHSIGGVVAKSEKIRNFFTGRSRLMSHQKNLILWDSFISKALYCSDAYPEKSSNNVFGYFYTSGTTYGRKSVIITNENVIAAASQYAVGLESGNSILNIMPLFTCYSVTIAMHLPLSIGIRVIIIPLAKPKNLKKIILHEKPNYMISVPAHWEYFIKDPPRGVDLSFLKRVTVGGDVVSSEYEARLNKIFAECGSQARLLSGYGLTETTSAAAFTFGDRPRGSVGQPLLHTKITIRDVNTGEVLEPFCRGEICINGPTVCKGYFNEDKLTQKLLQTHENGTLWLHSGDIGYCDENGNLFFCERMKRMYVRFDGTKISPYSIEQVILRSPIVERCLVVAIRDEKHSHGMCAKTFIVLKKGTSKQNARKLLNSYFVRELDEHMIPREIEFVDKLPYTVNGKLDYFMSEKEKE